MRRKQFLQLIYDLRAELGRAVDPAAGVADLPSLKQIISRNYESVYDEYDWPHLSVMSDRIPLAAGQQFYDFPADVDYDSIERVVVWWNGQPSDLTRGIDFEDYAEFDPAANYRRNPATNWDVRFTGIREQMEIWPLPASSAASIQIKGKRKFTPLIDEADLCLVDDALVVLTCAVELLPRQKSGDAQVKLAALQSRYSRKKGRSKGANNRSYKIGLGSGTSSAKVSSRSVVRVRR